MPEAQYIGTELELFAQARNWKNYWSGNLRKYVRGDVLEVGAGIGANVRLLHDAADNWVCLEPDIRLARELQENLQHRFPDRLEVICGRLKDVVSVRQFDSILYIDVLEHIKDDVEELANAADRLKAGGNLVVLAPAHPLLFTPFDKAIGHERRYSARTLSRSAPKSLRLEKVYYLDSVGLCASLGNKLLLGSAMPTIRQIRMWDRIMIPCSTRLDAILGYRVGKSVVAVWRKE
jgi:SAM-dependent methyltransferase